MVLNDKDAKFCFEKVYKTAEIEPTVAKPHSPDNKALVREVEDVKLDRAYIGSCTGGKITDFKAAARIMKGHKVAIDAYVVPATMDIQKNLKIEKIGGESLYDIFVNAGAKIGPASCGACLGGPLDTFGRLNKAEVCISTTNRNFPGRMGSKSAQVFLASPFTVAASALTGHITDPRSALS